MSGISARSWANTGLVQSRGRRKDKSFSHGGKEREYREGAYVKVRGWKKRSKKNNRADKKDIRNWGSMPECLRGPWAERGAV